MTDQAPVHLSSKALRQQFDPSSRLDEYCRILKKENQRVNLVSRETSPAQMLALATDSLVPLALLGPTPVSSYMDIGSGGGFPAIPLLLSEQFALSRKPVLVERIGKKEAALRRIVIPLGLEIESIATDLAQAGLTARFDLITLRFVKLTPLLLRTALARLSPNGVLAYFSVPKFDSYPSGVTAELIPYMIDHKEPVRHLTLFRTI